MGLFTPAWMSENPAKALKALEKEKRQEILFKMAEKAPLIDIRLKAVARLSDPLLLKSIAVSPWGSLAKAALMRLTDQNLLSEIAQNAIVPSVRVDAVMKLHDQDLIGKLALSKERALAEAALARLTEQKQLVIVALNSTVQSMRLDAIKKISDQQLLVHLASQCRRSDMFRMTMEKITDEETRLELAYAALNRDSARAGDLPELLSPAHILQLAERVAGIASRDVMELLDDQHALARHYKKPRSEQAGERELIRDAIVKKMTDERLMEDIINDSSLEESCRYRLVWHIKDKDILSRIADTHPEEKIRTKAALELGEPGRLARIGKSTDDTYTFHEVLRKLNDPETLADIALAQTTTFAMQALKNITNVPALLRIQTQTADAQIQAAAQARLTGYACKKCGHDNTNDPARSELCVCAKCGAENHIMERRSNVTEYRDYASGSRWDECTRCGMTRNYETVDTGFLE